jgi:hypothetical protein
MLAECNTCLQQNMEVTMDLQHAFVICCCAGAPPFNADTPQEIFERILDCNVEFILDEDGQHVVSQECRDLISALLQVCEV